MDDLQIIVFYCYLTGYWQVNKWSVIVMDDLQIIVFYCYLTGYFMIYRWR